MIRVLKICLMMTTTWINNNAKIAKNFNPYSIFVIQSLLPYAIYPIPYTLIPYTFSLSRINFLKIFHFYLTN